MLVEVILLLAVGSSVQGYDYTIVGAKVFRVGAVNNIVLNLHGYTDTAVVGAKLWTLPRRESQFAIFERTELPATQPIPISFKVDESELVERRNRNTYVELEMEVSQSDDDFIKKIPVLLNFTSGYLFLTTNRPAYRPGENVEIVVALLDQDLRVDNLHEVDIIVRTPADSGKIGVQKTSKTLSPREYIRDSFQLGSAPLLGVWFVEASVPSLGIKEEVSFLVKRYVLPTFNVRVDLDQHYILNNSYDINGTIHAEYSYGRKVYGQYFIFVTLVRPGHEPLEVYKKPSRFNIKAYISSGIKRFSIPKSAITSHYPIEDLVSEGATLIVEATVTGDESIFESGRSRALHFTDSPYVIKTDRSSKYFVPWGIYDAKIDVRDAVTLKPVPGLSVNIIAGEVYADRTDDRGQILWQLETANLDQLEITITTADSRISDMDQATAILNVQPLTGAAHISISVQPGRIHVGDMLYVEFRFEPSLPWSAGDVRYFVVSLGQVVSQGIVEYPANHQGDLYGRIEINQQMIPSARLVAYYMRGNRVVANSVWFNVENQCAGKELSVTLLNNVFLPQTTIFIEVTGNPSAVFHMSAVDRAAYFVYNDSRLTRDELWDKMASYDPACSREGGSTSKNVFEEAGLFVTSNSLAPTWYRSPVCHQEPIRRKRQVLQEDVIQIKREQFLSSCAQNGMIPTLTNETCADRGEIVFRNEADQECVNRFIAACLNAVEEESSLTGGRSNMGPNVLVSRAENNERTDFNENWIWETKHLGQNGRYSWETTVPGSISTFDFTTFSYSDHGFCIAKPKKVTIFRNLFIQLYLPYSLRLLEQATLRYSVFNYGQRDRVVSIYDAIVETTSNTCLTVFLATFPALNLKIVVKVDVGVNHTDELCSLFKPNTMRRIATLNVPGNSAVSSTFNVIPIKLPKRPAGASIVMRAGPDSIRKFIKIEPRGLLKESSKTFILQPDQTVSFTFDISTSFEPKSRTCHIYAYASLMGPVASPDPITQTFSNLQNLINSPGYSGEQNMIRIAPSIYVYKYRKATGQVEDGSPEFIQVVKNIQEGYIMQLNVRSDQVQKRAWAVWNNHPPSLWLNAFVDRVFTEARDIWPQLDVEPICRSLHWILEQQNSDGSFNDGHPVIHGEIDGLVEGVIATTAYVTVALAESQSVCPNLSEELRAARSSALQYIEGQHTLVASNPYVLAVTAYALAYSGNQRNSALQWNQRLMNQAIIDDDYISWPSTQGRAGMVETAAYALLAQIKLADDPVTEENLQRTRKIALWLISQQNSHGGFVSTQDTVMGLQATTSYMTWMSTINVVPPSTNLSVLIRTRRGTPWFDSGRELVLTNEQQHLRKDIPIPEEVIGTNLSVSVTGQGEGTLSYRCTWRETVNTTNCLFEVDAKLENNVVKVTVMKPRGPPLNMSIIEVGLLSGFKPVKQSIDNLDRDKVVDGKVDRYEITNNTVIFYVSKISSDVSRLYFKVIRETRVKNPQPAAVTVYDYYNPDITCTKFYALKGSGSLELSCNDNQNMCKCAEGGCVKCRRFAELAYRTARIFYTTRKKNEEKKSLNTCDHPDIKQCFQSEMTACSKVDYLYYVKITRVRMNQPPNFVEFDATILLSPRKALNDQELQANRSVRTFRMKHDCFTKCEKDLLTRNVSLIVVDQELIIFGKSPDMWPGEGGSQEILYYLDDAAYIEPHLPKRICNRVNRWFSRKNIDCRIPSKKIQRKCDRWFSRENINCRIPGKRFQRKCEKLRVCNYQNALQASINTGCG